jgi:hypothetical protein
VANTFKEHTMNQLADFYCGDTKRWSVTFPYDITLSTVTFRMAKSLSQEQPDLSITGVLGDPNENGDILSATLEITAAQSAGLEPGSYHAEHTITTDEGDVGTFLPQQIKAKRGVPRG